MAIIRDLNLIDSMDLCGAHKTLCTMLIVPRVAYLNKEYPDKLARDRCRQLLYRALVRTQQETTRARRNARAMRIVMQGYDGLPEEKVLVDGS